MEEVDRISRELRTPITDAVSALDVAFEFFVELMGSLMAKDPSRDYGKLANSESYFLTQFFDKAWGDPDTNGDKAVDAIGLSLDGKRDPDEAPFALLQIMCAVVAYAVQAMKAQKSDKRDLAWAYAVDASYWAGILRFAWAEKRIKTNPAAELAKKRHADHYTMTNDALKYWRERIDPSLSASKAAGELMRVVPLSHRKLAEVVAAEKKKKQP